jgi:hypothetical protein
MEARITKADEILFLLNKTAYKEDFGDEMYEMVSAKIKGKTIPTKTTEKSDNLIITVLGRLGKLLSNIISESKDSFKDQMEGGLVPSSSTEELTPVIEYYSLDDDSMYELKIEIMPDKPERIEIEFLKNGINTDELDDEICYIKSGKTKLDTEHLIQNGMLIIDLSEIGIEFLGKNDSLSDYELTISIGDREIELS